MPPKIIIWFRKDLRLNDNSALEYAAQMGQIIPVYIFDKQEDNEYKLGQASKWWLHHSLTELAKSLAKLGHNLNIFQGNCQEILKDIIEKTNAKNIAFNICYEPYEIKRDKAIKEYFKKENIEINIFNSNLLFKPWHIKNKQDGVFKVFTPFWKHCLTQNVEPISNSCNMLNKYKPFDYKLSHLSICNLNLLPKINWAKDIEKEWQPGEEGALKKFEFFMQNNIQSYKIDRNFMDKSAANSLLSPHLHFGEISPRYIWHHVQNLLIEKTEWAENIACFLSEIGWREFAYYLIYHMPSMPFEPIKSEFENFPWQEDATKLKLWQQGKTGIPMIDAAMKQLWKTGYMHNRARMIVASFLTKNLLISWQNGAKWFWDTLVDADLANNSMGWQWVAGCGVDAAPYFRIFNPIAQGQKFDPCAEYIKKWLPELKNLSLEYIYNPWLASTEELKNAGIELGKTYPFPIIDLSQTRNTALNIYQTIKKYL